MKFEFPIAITMMITDLLDVASCSLVDTYQVWRSGDRTSW
jgi:hypothetical protein